MANQYQPSVLNNMPWQTMGDQRQVALRPPTQLQMQGVPQTGYNPGDTSVNYGGWPMYGGSPLGYTLPSGDWSAWQSWSPEDVQKATAYYQQFLPASQMAQNAYQYGQDFGESQRRFNEQFAWQQEMEKAQADLARQQQAWQEQWLPQQLASQQAWQTGENTGARNWQTGERLGTQDWQAAQNLGQQQWQTGERLGQQGWQSGENLAARGWQTGEREATNVWQAAQNEANRALTREQMAAEAENASLAAFGRRMRPNSRYL